MDLTNALYLVRASSALSTAPVVPVTPSIKDSSVSLKISAFSHPFFRVAAKDPSCFIIFSTSIPCHLATLAACSWKVSRLIPVSVIFFDNFSQELFITISAILFLASADFWIMSLIPFTIVVNRSVACSLSPIIVCQVCAHPEPAAS